MKKNILFFICLTIIALSCITIKPHLTGDGSKELTHQDSLHITGFNLDSALVFHYYGENKLIFYQTLKAENLMLLLGKKPYNWIMIGSSWCPVSDVTLKKAAKVFEKFNPDSLQFIYINQDFNLKELNKMLHASSFHGVPYLFDLNKYGDIEKNKQTLFFKDLQWGIPERMTENGGVPLLLLTKSNQELIYTGRYTVANVDSIKKYTGLSYK